MKQEHVNLIKKIYSIIIVVLTILLAALSIMQIVDIYLSGIEPGNQNQMYTEEIIWDHFTNIALPLVIWIVSLIFGFVFYIIFPSKEKFESQMASNDLLKMFASRLPDNIESYKEDNNKLLKEQKSRKIALIITILVLIGLSIPCFIYLFNPNHFTQDGDLMLEAGTMVLNIIPWYLLGTGTLIAYKTFTKYSYKSEINHIKDILSKSADTKRASIIRPVAPSKKMIMTTRIAILVVAITFIITGIINGGAADVLKKAINICTECIGLG